MSKQKFIKYYSYPHEFLTHKRLNSLTQAANDTMQAPINNNPSKSCVNALL